MIAAKRTVANLAPYVAPLEGRRAHLRLDFNENTIGPSPKVLEAIRALPPEAYATYPEYSDLAAVYGKTAGVNAENVGVFNGADAAIRALFDAYGEAGTTVLTTAPTFGYYRPCAEIAGMTIHAVPYTADMEFPWQEFRAALASRHRLCLLCNPNNPTSTLVEPDAILELADSAPDTLFAIDEIYESYTGKSVLPGAVQRDNVVALRSLSKAAGLAALRIGFVCGNAEVISCLDRVTGPYDINMFAVVAARAALADPDHVARYVAAVAEAKEYTLERLQQLGLRHYSGGGNYLLVWPGRGVAEVEAALRQRGVLVRSMAGKPLIGGSFRLSIGTRAQMEQFFEALDGALS